MSIRLYATHPLYKLSFTIDVHESWVVEYLQFYFNLKYNSTDEEGEIIYIYEAGDNNIKCQYKSHFLKTKFDVAHITGKMTSWIIGVINDILFDNSVYVLHGSSCLYNSRTLLFIGNKCEGKTTLLYKVLLDGGQYLSDDNIYYSCNDASIYYSDIGMRIKNKMVINRNHFDLLKIEATDITYIQPKNRFRSFSKPDKIFILSQNYGKEFQEANFVEFLQIVLSNMKNSNSGKINIKNLIKLYNTVAATKINAFNILDIHELIAKKNGTK